MFKKVLLACTAGLALASAGFAQTNISADDRAAAVREIAELIGDEYFDATRAEAIENQLNELVSSGALDDFNDAESLSTHLTQLLLEEDRHFSVNYRGMEAGREAVAAAEAAEARRANRSSEPQRAPRDRFAGLRQQNFGFGSVEILDGNIGYIKMDMFAPIEGGMDTANAALGFVAGTNAVIFDLRENRGGAPSMVQYLISHFLEDGGDTLINTFVSRDLEYPNQMWSIPHHPMGHRPDVPVIVLTSGATGSAGEAFPYHLQALERGTIIGESTYGAGNPGGTWLTDLGYEIFISTGSARNPITGTNWEGTGVTPDIEVASDDALNQAMLTLYPQLIENTEDDNARRSLVWGQELLRAEMEPIEISASDLEDYVGTFGIRSTRMDNGQLVYQREGNPPITLIALGDDRFAFPGDNMARLVFDRDRRGRVISMDLHMIRGRVIPNPRTD